MTQAFSSTKMNQYYFRKQLCIHNLSTDNRFKKHLQYVLNSPSLKSMKPNDIPLCNNVPSTIIYLNHAVILRSLMTHEPR